MLRSSLLRTPELRGLLTALQHSATTALSAASAPHAATAPLTPTPATAPSAGVRSFSSSATPAADEPAAASDEAAAGEAATEPAPEWTPQSKRVGLVGVKMGMMPVWDSWGKRHAATVIGFPDNVVAGVAGEPKAGKGKDSCEGKGMGKKKVLVGAKKVDAAKVAKPQLGMYEAAGVEPRAKLVEFAVTEDAVPPVGTDLVADHFVAGQYVDVRGVSRGKGFAGVMKRYNFKGQSASHGTSVAHRHAGSTGGSQGPGKVWKNKKMAGRMGGKRRTVQSLRVLRVEPEDGVILVRGSIPGPTKGWVIVNDAIRKQFPTSPPFPVGTPADAPSDAPASDDDPFAHHWDSGDRNAPSVRAKKGG